MVDLELKRFLRRHVTQDETLRTAMPAYLGAGFRRAVLGVTDSRVLLVRSSYWSLRDKGLLWADPLDGVALGELPVELKVNRAYTGNTYVRMRRADGSRFRLNPRPRFVGGEDETRANVRALYSAIPGRF